MTLLAVHLMDHVLQPAWLVGGFLVAIALGWLGSRRLRLEEYPRIALLSAAFFVASTVHVPIPGTSVHLLLNGLMGVLLGPRAALAIPLGLALQALLLGHGGVTTLGVNACIMELPALAAWLGFRAIRDRTWFQHSTWQSICGFLLGSLPVLGSSLLNSLTLWLGGVEGLSMAALAAFVAHLPVAVLEGFVVASTVPFLAKVKPEMLGMTKTQVATHDPGA